MNKIVNGVANDYEFPQLERITIPTESECYLGIIREYQREVERLNNRIEKTVEYIRQQEDFIDEYSLVNREELLNILNGRSDE